MAFTKDITSYLKPEKRTMRELSKEARTKRSDYKCITAGNDPKTAVTVGPTHIDLSAIPMEGGTKPIGIGVHLKGLTFRGSCAFMTTLDRFGLNACWTLNPALMGCVPSTLSSPISTLSFTLPFQAAVRMISAIKTIEVLSSEVLSRTA
jgi:hypothetical protein